MNIDEIAKAERRAYHKEWCKKNRDKRRMYNKNYWEKKALEKLQNKSCEGKKYEN